MGTIVVGGILLVVVVLVTINTIKNRNKCSCGSSCGSCKYSTNCNPDSNAEKAVE